MNRGCPQGNKTSPFFFNIVINSLITDLKEILGLYIMVFADDIALLADSRTALNKGQECVEK